MEPNELLSTIDPRVRKLIPVYLKNRVADLASLDQAMVASDYEEIERVGHRLKGNARTFGFPALEQLGIELEQAAQNRKTETLRELIDRYKSMLSALNGGV